MAATEGEGAAKRPLLVPPAAPRNDLGNPRSLISRTSEEQR